MVFSLFKKPEKKVIAKPPVKPPSPSGTPTGTTGTPRSGVSSALASGVRSVPAHKPVAPGEQGGDEFEFSDHHVKPGLIELQLKDSHDPMESDIEEAAILYANGQDAATRAMLEAAVQTHHFGPGERLWLMLFDFYQLTDCRPEFESLGIEYAQAFEKSPPMWAGDETSAAKPKLKAMTGPSTISFKAGIIESNTAPFDSIRQNQAKANLIRLDFSQTNQFDIAGCNKLLESIREIRKSKCPLKLLGRDALQKKLSDHVMKLEQGQGSEFWLLLLELYQIAGLEDLFEEMAINYAVTFEMSPPSWDPSHIDISSQESVPLELEDSDEPPVLEEIVEAGNTYPLHGEIKNFRYEGLADFAKAHSPIIIDFSQVKRIDFVSAGTLINVLTPASRTGKTILIERPNYLVAALLNVVGLQAVAEIRFAKK